MVVLMSQPIALSGTEVRIVHSDAMDFDFEISIRRPLVDPGTPLPVVYFTDADMTMGFVSNMTDLLLQGGEMPPGLSVGIGYPVDSRDLEYIGQRRMYDFSPTRDEFQLAELYESALSAGKPEAGGAPKFIQFMRDELWPWLTQNFNVADDRTYVGDSMGGLFGTYVLFNHPGFFNRYIIGSPWICWDHPLCFDYEEAYAANHDDLRAVVFLSAGGAEDVLSPAFDPNAAKIFEIADTEAHTLKMGERLASRGYPGLKLKTLIFPEETHFTVPYALIPHGLRYVFGAGA